MNTIILQKKYLVLVETAQDMWTLFLVIVNYIFTIKDKVEVVVESSINVIKDNVEIVRNGVDHFSKVIYSYFTSVNKAYIPLLVRTDNSNNDIAYKIKDDRYIYSNLLAPPHF